MNTSILGSSFELSLRILMLLNDLKGQMLDEHQIGAIDYISVYAADFGLMDENLHGNGTYRFSEYSARKNRVFMAVKELVLDGYVYLHPTSKGYCYSITDEGSTLCDAMSSDYTQEYVLAVQAVVENFDISNTEVLIQEINRLTIESLKESGHE